MYEQICIDFSLLQVPPVKRKYECFAKREKSREVKDKIQFDLVAPDGKVHRGTGLNKFCKKQGLSYKATKQVIDGRLKSHKKWRRYAGRHTGVATNVTLSASTLTKAGIKRANRSLSERNSLIRYWLPKCDRIAAYYTAGNFELKDDLTQVARLGLVWSATKFCEQGGEGDFSKYGAAWIRNSIRSFLREEWSNNKNYSLEVITGWRQWEEKYLTGKFD